MGLFLLVLFVGGSLAFALRAWASYGEGAHQTPDAAAGKKETPLIVALAAVTFLCSFLSEFLRHALRLSFLEAGAISLVVAVTGQWVALRFLGKEQREAQD